MTIIEQIKAEIERRKKSLRAGICNEEVFTRRQRTEMLVASEELDRLNRFLSTLESEKPVPNDLDFEQELYNHFGQIKDFTLGMRIGQYFYNLGRDSVPLPEDTVLFNNGVEEGKRLMMKGAVEGDFMLNPYPIICLDDCKNYDFKEGDKVKLIICTED